NRRRRICSNRRSLCINSAQSAIVGIEAAVGIYATVDIGVVGIDAAVDIGAAVAIGFEEG
ncbi:hypothetical protein U1Q18_009528, partial [Sarracenia purpurea var. burkii]